MILIILNFAAAAIFQFCALAFSAFFGSAAITNEDRFATGSLLIVLICQFLAVIFLAFAFAQVTG